MRSRVAGRRAMRSVVRATLLLALSACSAPGPRAIAYGEEQCAFCRMTVSDPRFGAQVRTATGRTHTFDSIECMASFVDAASEADLRGAWVSDFENPGTFLPADSAVFWQRDGGGSPMGMGLVATARTAAPAGAPAVAGPLGWAEVRALVASRSSPKSEASPVEHRHAAAPGDSSGTVTVSLAGAVRTVAEGVRLAPPGGRVVVLPGTYREPTVLVTKPLTIEGRGHPTLDGEGERELLRVRADDVTIRGLRFTRVGVAMTEDRAAVRVTESRRCTITDNRFDDTFFGVYLAKVEGCRVEGNVFAGRGEDATESTSGNGIHLWSVRDVDVRGNRIAGHRDGIYFEFVRQGRVADNVSEHNLRYGLHFMYSDSSDYVGNRFRENGSGVAVMYSNVIAMRENTFLDNRGAAAYGLLLKEIGEPVLARNVFAGNTVALMADGTTRLAANGNRFAHNGTAVRLMANLQEGRFTANDFVGNTFDVTTNGRSAEDVEFAGNYFGDYRGYDIDRDGGGDVPHRPVRLFSLLVERYEPVLVLQRSAFVALLDAAERVLPGLTPERLADARPAMGPVASAASPIVARATRND